MFKRRVSYYFKRIIIHQISNFILVMCSILFLVALLASVTHRVPIISEFGETINYPHKFELNGVVEMIDCKGPVLVPVEISIGGFSENTFSNDNFKLIFVSNHSENIPVIISYKYKNLEFNKLERISFHSDYSINYVFTIKYGE